jgi:hypothetical protein
MGIARTETRRRGDRLDHPRRRGDGDRIGSRLDERVVTEPAETGGTPHPPAPAAPRGSAQRSLGSIVLGFEFLVVFLGALVIFGLKALPPAVALGGGGALVLAMLLTIPLLRYRVGFMVGWVLQAVVIASGFLNGVMFVVGAIFAALWAYCMIVGARLDRTNAARAAVAGPATDEQHLDQTSATDTTKPETTE